MTKPFKVESAQIKQLSDLQLTQLLNELLHAEAQKFGIANQAVEVALNIRVGDGGEDGRISWVGGIESTDYVPNRLTMFQNKAAEMGPTEYANEIMTKATANNPSVLKPKVEEVLDSGGAYIVFTTQELNKQKKDTRINAIREKLNREGKAYAFTCTIEIYDASQIAGWVNLYVSAIVSVLSWVGSQLERGLKTYEIWSEHEELSIIPFQSVESRNEMVSTIQDKLKEEKSCCRIVGLSGLGKTRIAHHLLGESNFLKKLVVYIDANHYPQIDALIADWVSLGLHAIVVVDNCDYKLHERLVNEIKRSKSHLRLLSLDYSFESVSQDTLLFKLEIMDDDELLQLLDPIYNKVPDLNRIVEFAQGFPQMAVLLAEARLADDPRLGELSNDGLANKLLWGHDGIEDKEQLKILRVCSLFDFFGIDKEAESQLQHISDFLGMDIDDVYDCVKEFTARGLIDRRGRFAQLVPKPLAIRLAGQWWSKTRNAKQKEFVDDIPDEMIEGFCKQIEKLDFLQEVKELTKKLCGPQGNFGQAEVILSERGSRLFRSFVIVNPEATSQSLYNILEKLTNDEIYKITGDVRRNLVWSLELLCFREKYFEKSAWCLFQLALNENESWSNNATGLFKQLHRVTLSGTEATPEQRFKVLNRIMNLKNEAADMILLEALGESIDTFGGSRTIGAEHQGTKETLEEWKPKIWQDVYDYWDESFKILLDVFQRGDKQKQKVMKLIGQSIRGFVRSGRIDMLDYAIKYIVEKNGPYWPDALESIQNTLEFDMEKMPQEGKDALHRWCELLRPDNANLEEQLKIIVIDPPWNHSENDEGKLIDVAQKKAVEFAAKISSQSKSLKSYIPILLSGEQRQTFSFAVSLASNLDLNDLLVLINQTIGDAIKVERPNLTFLAGLFKGLSNKDVMHWDSKLQELLSNKETVDLYPDMITSGEITTDHLDVLIDLIKTSKIKPEQVIQLSYGSVTEHLRPSELVAFCTSLAEIDDSCIWPSLNIMYMYYFGEKAHYDEIKPALKKLSLSASLNPDKKNSPRDSYQWKGIVEKLLDDNDDEFAKSLAIQIVDATKKEIDYSDMSNYIKPILFKLFENYGEKIWPIIGDSVINAEGMQLHRLKSLLDKQGKFRNKKPSALNLVPSKIIIDWCNINLEKGPEFIATCVNIFEITEDKTKESQDQVESKKTTDLFISLLENFGEDKKVQGALFSNIISRGWSGSLIPYLEADKIALQPLTEHPNESVRNWVDDCIEMLNDLIKKEKESEDEEDFGIY